MQHSSFLHRTNFWKRLIWLVIIGTMVLLIAITWLIQKNVDRIDREFEKTRTYETQ